MNAASPPGPKASGILVVPVQYVPTYSPSAVTIQWARRSPLPSLGAAPRCAAFPCGGEDAQNGYFRAVPLRNLESELLIRRSAAAAAAPDFQHSGPRGSGRLPGRAALFVSLLESRRHRLGPQGPPKYAQNPRRTRGRDLQGTGGRIGVNDAAIRNSAEKRWPPGSSVDWRRATNSCWGVVLISHRFSTVRMADRIIVLSNGSVSEQGSHEVLMDAQGLYAELFALQAAGYR